MATTIKDIARETGYAESTVANVLNNHKSCFASARTRQLIHDTAKRLGYRPNYFARGLSRRRSFLIGVAGSLWGAEVLGRQLAGIIGPLQQQGYEAFFADTRGETVLEREAITRLRDKQVEGLIYLTVASDALLKEVVPADIPTLLIPDRLVEGFCCLVIDRAGSMVRATRRLLELGHRRIAFVASTILGNRRKYEGHRQVMEGCGLFDPALTIEQPYRGGSFVRLVSERPDFFRSVTAILAVDDKIAIEVMTGLETIGVRVPQDCSVIGYDDIDIAAGVSPSLTTIRQPREEVGKLAVEMILRRIRGEAVGNRMLLPELIERASIGPCPAR